MSQAPEKLIARHVKQVRRRLWLQTLLLGLVGGWSAAFLAAGIFFLVRAAFWGPLPEGQGWLVLGGAWTAGTLAAIFWAWLRAPGSLSSLLALDKKFELRERVTTFCSLSPEQTQTPAGQALLEDVQRKVAGIDVAAGFPLRLRMSQAMMPVCAAVLALSAMFFAPQLDFGGSSRRSAQGGAALDPNEVKLPLDNLKKVHFEKEADTPRSKEFKEIEDELDKLLKKELDPRNDDQVRQTIEAMRNLEEKMKERIADLKNNKEKNKDVQTALDRLDKLARKLNKEGPAQDFQDALAKGNMKKAMEELEKLKKKLENNELSKTDRDKLAQQLQDLKEQLQRLHDQKEERDQLQKDFEDGKLDKEQLDRELERLNQESQNLEDLQELADLLGECKNCLGKGDGKGLSGKLERLKGKLKELDIDEAELKRLLAEAEEIEKARLLMLAACQGQCQGNGLGQGKNPGAKRPVGEDPKDSKISEQRQKAETDPQGKMRITGFSKGGTFSKIPAKEVGGAFQRAEQESSAVLERQRIPADAADVAKGYFNKLGGQK